MRKFITRAAARPNITLHHSRRAPRVRRRTIAGGASYVPSVGRSVDRSLTLVVNLTGRLLLLHAQHLGWGQEAHPG